MVAERLNMDGGDTSQTNVTLALLHLSRIAQLPPHGACCPTPRWLSHSFCFIRVLCDGSALREVLCQVPR